MKVGPLIFLSPHPIFVCSARMTRNRPYAVFMDWTLKKLTLLVAFIALAVYGNSNHIAGANIEYECLGSGQYLVRLSVFQDCLDTNVPNSYSVRIVNEHGNFTSRSLTKVLEEEVSQLCTGLIDQSLCNGGLQPGYKRVVYEYTGTIEESTWAVSSELRIFFKWNYRTASLNVDNSTALQFYVHSIVYPFVDGCHDSPTVTAQTVPFVCVGNPTTLNFGVLEHGQDSLHFSLADALQPGASQGFASVPYEPGYSGSAPIPGITIDSNTGQIDFTAPIQGLYTIAILVEQFDQNGDLTSTQVVDVLITAITCPNAPPTAIQDELVNTSGTATFVDPLNISMCYGDDFCADYEFQSSSSSADITITSNIDQVLPGATLTVTGSNPATVTICWTANDQSTGGNIVLTASDDLCPVPGIVAATFHVEVRAGVYAGPDQSFCPGSNIQLGASGSDNYTWTSISGDGTGIFDCTNCPDPTFTPTQTSVYEVSGSSSGNGCNTVDQVSIEAALDYTSNTVNTGCSQDDGEIHIDIQTGSGDYSVIFGGNTIPLTSSSFDTTGLIPGTYNMSLLDNSLGCSVNLSEDVSIGVVIPDPGIIPPSQVCGLSENLNGTSNSGVIVWSGTGPGSISFDDNSLEDPTVTVGTPGTYRFYIQETNSSSGCSAVDSIDIVFQVLSPVTAGIDSALCALDYTMLGSATGGTWTWFDLSGQVSFGTNINDPASPISVSNFGSYSFIWTYEYPNGCDTNGTFVIDFLATPNAQSPDTLTFCELADNNFSAVPPGTDETGYWDILTGSFTHGLEYDAIIQNTGSFGEFEAVWTVENPGCSSTDTTLLRYIQPEDADITTATNQICGPSIDLAASNLTGTWSCSDTDMSFSNAGNNTTTATVASPGGYTVDWTVGQGVCATVDSWTMFFTDSAQSAIGTLPTEICSIDSINLTGTVSNGNGHTWSSSGNGDFLSPSSLTGIYVPGSTEIETGNVDITLTQSGSGVCPDVASSATLFILGAAEVDAGISGPSSICSDDFIQLDGTPLNTTSTVWTSPGDGEFIGITDDPRYYPGSGDILTGSFYLHYSGISASSVCPDVIDSVLIQITGAAEAGTDSSISICVSAPDVDVALLFGAESQAGGILTETTSSGALTGSIFSPSVAGVGTYTFNYTVSGLAPCTDSQATATIEVTEGADAGTGSNLELCTSGSVVDLFTELNDSPQSGGTWSEENGSSALTGSNFDPNNSGPGQFNIKYLVSVTGCLSDSAMINIEVGVPPTGEAGLDVQNICVSDEILLNGVPTDGDSILWSSSGDGSFLDESSSLTSYEAGVSDLIAGNFTLSYTVYGFPGCPVAIDQISVTLDDVPVAGDNNSTTLCSSSSPLDLTTLLSTQAESGGSWTDLDGSGALTGSTFDPSSVAIGLYDFGYTVSSPGACPDSIATMTVEVSSAADAGQDRTIIVCENSTVLNLTDSLDGNPQAGGSWTGVESSLGLSGDELDISLLSAGTFHYQYVVTIPGCSPSAQAELTVEILAPPVVDIPWDQLSICENQAIILNSNVSGHTSLLWETTGNGVFSQTDIEAPSYVLGTQDLSAGEVEIFLTAEGAPQCPSTIDSVQVDIQSLPAVDAGLVTVQVCEDSSLVLNATASDYQDLLWSSAGNGSFSADGSLNTEYQLGTTDLTNGSVVLTLTANGLGTCTAQTDDILVQIDSAPFAGLDGSVSVCESGSIIDLFTELNGSPESPGTWSDPDGSGALSGSNFDPNSSSPGSYELIYAVSNAGLCPSDSASVQVLVETGPQSGEDGTESICQSVTDFDLFSALEGSPEAGGTWTDLSGTGALSGGTFNASIPGAGTYVFRYTVSEVGCADVSAEVSIGVVPAPTASIDAHPGTICSGEAILLDASVFNAMNLNWTSSGSGEFDSVDQDNITYSPSSADIISGSVILEIEAEGGTGCLTATDQITINIIAVPNTNAGSDQELCGLSGNLNASTSVGNGAWQPVSGVIFDNLNDPFSGITVPAFGEYNLTWTEDNLGCSDSDQVLLTFLDSPDSINSNIECINTNTEFVLSFDIQGGDPSSYSVTGDGTLIGATYTSSPVPTGTSYLFELSDTHECEIVQISGTFICPSLSDAGSMGLDTLHLCEGELAQGIFLNDAFLDDNDAQAFLLHDSEIGIGTILAQSTSPEFMLQAGMNQEQVYFISSMVGDDDGSGSPDPNAASTVFSNPSPVIFHISPSVTPSSNEVSFCEGQSLSLSLSFSGNPVYELSYSFNGTPAIEDFASSGGHLDLNENGLLILTDISDSYCSTVLSDSITSTVIPSPSLALDDTLRTCNNELLPIELTFSGTGPWNYNLSINGIDQGVQVSTQAEQDISPINSGIYLFTNITDQDCLSSESYQTGVDVVSTPFSDAGPDMTICSGDTVSIGSSSAAGVIYSWNQADLLNTPDSSSTEVYIQNLGEEPIQEIFQITSSFDICSSEDEVTLVVNPIPLDATVEGEQDLCLGDSIILTAIGGESIFWSPSDDLEIISNSSVQVQPSADNSYSVEISNQYLCSQIIDWPVQVHPLPVASMETHVLDACPPAEVLLINTTDEAEFVNCTWEAPGGTLENDDCSSSTIRFPESGAYLGSLLVTNEFGCAERVISDSIQVAEAEAQFIFYPAVPTPDDSLIYVYDNSENSLKQLWLLEGDSVASGSTADLSTEGLRPDFYSVCLIMTTTEGCVDTLCKSFELENNVTVWVPNTFTPNGDGLNDELFAVVNGYEYVEQFKFRVFDRKGHVKFETKTPSQGWDGINIRGNGIMQGVYQWDVIIKAFGEPQPRQYRGYVNLLK